MPVFATLIDFDGVLVDSELVHLAAFNDVLAPRGITIDEKEYVERYLSLGDAAVFRAVISRRGKTIREEEVRALVEAKNPRFMARFEGAFRVWPGAQELLARRAARGPVGIVSGALEREIEYALAKMGTRGHVAFIVSAERSAASKPDPAPYEMGLHELARLRHTGRIVAIEDATGGVRSAKGAGLRCVGVAHSYTAAQLLEAGADAVVPDLASLTDAFLEGA